MKASVCITQLNQDEGMRGGKTGYKILKERGHAIMATYIEKFGGYIADVPKVVFKRCDGKKFLMDELTAATVTPTINTTEINAGWSLFPVAVLPGQSTFEMSFTSGKFEAEMFSMANKTEFEHRGGQDEKTYAFPRDERHEIVDNKITLIETPVEGSIYIDGMEEVEATPELGQYTVAGKVITFNAGESGTIQVLYDSLIEAYEAIITNKEAAIGEATAIWPVYGSGDDCTESSIIGYYVVKVFRARVTTVPGIDTSYKTAATFQFTLSALNNVWGIAA